jgi:hypothetical protein
MILDLINVLSFRRIKNINALIGETTQAIIAEINHSFNQQKSDHMDFNRRYLEALVRKEFDNSGEVYADRLISKVVTQAVQECGLQYAIFKNSIVVGR